MRIFLAVPFRSKINKTTGVVHKEYKKWLLSLKSFLTNLGFDVYLALERENWGKDFWKDEDCTRIDHKEITDSDIVIAYVDEEFSGGVHIELGWASTLGKKIAIVTKDESCLCPLAKGLISLCDLEVIVFSSESELHNKLTRFLRSTSRFPNSGW